MKCNSPNPSSACVWTVRWSRTTWRKHRENMQTHTERHHPNRDSNQEPSCSEATEPTTVQPQHLHYRLFLFTWTMCLLKWHPAEYINPLYRVTSSVSKSVFIIVHLCPSVYVHVCITTSCLFASGSWIHITRWFSWTQSETRLNHFESDTWISSYEFILL